MRLRKRQGNGVAHLDHPADHRRALLSFRGLNGSRAGSGRDQGFDWEFRWNCGAVTLGLAAALDHIDAHRQEAGLHVEQGHFYPWYEINVTPQQGIATLENAIATRLARAAAPVPRGCRPADLSIVGKTTELRSRRAATRREEQNLGNVGQTLSLSEIAILIGALRGCESAAFRQLLPLASATGHEAPGGTHTHSNPAPPIRALQRKRSRDREKHFGQEHDTSVREVRSRGSDLAQKTLASAVIVTILLLGIGAIRNPTDRQDTPPETSPERSALGVEETQPAAALIAQAEGVARQFLGVTTRDELLSCVRNPQLTRVQLTSHYEDLTFRMLGRPEALEIKSLTSRKGDETVLFTVALQDSSERIHLCLIDEGDGFKVDWQAFVGYSERRWPEIISERPEEEVLVRSLCRKDFYYTDAFSEDAWQCYHLQNPNEEEILYAYAPRGTPLENQLNEMLSPSLNEKLNMFTATLLVRCLPETDTKQVQISGVISKGWVN